MVWVGVCELGHRKVFAHNLVVRVLYNSNLREVSVG